ncbi:MAG: hypothetical protein Q9165_002089 [Trypethelium subeluteriae]
MGFGISLLPLFIGLAQALGNITVANSITGDIPASVTYSDADSSTYKVYLAATVPGYPQGPSCTLVPCPFPMSHRRSIHTDPIKTPTGYLLNSTTLPPSGLNITIPASVGPSAPNYYSIALAPSSSSSSGPISYSAQFDFLGGTGTISDYEKHLGGAPLWYASQLPCTAYNCARTCAQEGYPDDLHGDGAYTLMNACIEACPGVTGGPPTPYPPGQGGNASSTTTTAAPSAGPSAGPGGVNATSTRSAGPGSVNATSTPSGGGVNSTAPTTTATGVPSSGPGGVNVTSTPSSGGVNSTAPSTTASSVPSGGPGSVNVTSTYNSGVANSTTPTTSLLSSSPSSEAPCETSATVNGNLTTSTYVGPKVVAGGIRGRTFLAPGVMATVVATATTIASEI